jgi:hypothetical protein
MIQCKVLRPFPFSKDGIRLEHADVDNTVLLPEYLVQGLARAGYVTLDVAKEPTFVEVAPETKVIVAAPETKPAWMK